LRRMVACAALLAAAALAQPVAAARVVFTSPNQPLSAVAGTSPSGALVACGRVVSTGGTPTTLARFRGATCYSTPRSAADTLVVTGQRVAWLVYGGGATLESGLVAARRPSTTASQIAFASVPDDGAGKDLAGVVAEGGGLLWAVRTFDEQSTITHTILRRQPQSGPQVNVVTLTGSARVLAAAQQRIVIADGAGHARLLDQAGAVVRDLGAVATRRATIVSGVVYLLRPGRLDLRSLNGTGTRSIPLAGTIGVRSTLAVRGGVAVYTTGTAVRAVRLSDGRDALVATGPAPGGGTDRGLVGATIDGGGIVYGINDRCSSQHVCRSRVLRDPVPF
jgi:hypothetical protein